MHFEKVDETVTFYKGPLPEPITSHRDPLMEVTQGTVMNNFYSLPKKVYIYTLHICVRGEGGGGGVGAGAAAPHPPRIFQIAIFGQKSRSLIFG